MSEERPPEPAPYKPVPVVPATLGREKTEPDELKNPVPWPLAVYAVILSIWGFSYYFQNMDYPVSAGDRRTAIVEQAADDIDGAQVYSANCVACHQGSGMGAAGVFPPLVDSRWVLGDAERLTGIMLLGIQGELEVQGTVYNGVMPAFSRLSDGELAAVMTHIRTTWGNDAGAIGVETVAEERERFADRTASWNGGAELDSTYGAD